jgi:hypothetical protein
MGNTDKIIWLIIVAGIAIFFFTGIIIGIVLLILAGVIVLTSLVDFCPLYTLFGMITCARKEAK